MLHAAARPHSAVVPLLMCSPSPSARHQHPWPSRTPCPPLTCSMLAAALAMERGWAINLGGGMHHVRRCIEDLCLLRVHASWPAFCARSQASQCLVSAKQARDCPPPLQAAPDAGGGWCPYADIHLALRRLRVASGGAATRFLYVDLDVHQVWGCFGVLGVHARRAWKQARGRHACCVPALMPAALPAPRRATAWSAASCTLARRSRSI